MLKCRDLVEHTDALLAGELTRRQRWAVRMHLLVCHHCRRYVRQFKDLLRAIPRMHGKAESAEIDKVMQQIREAQNAEYRN